MLVQAKEVHLSFGPKKLIRGASFVIEEQDRICLIGRNGTGKSTLFKIITEQIIPDSGEVLLKKNLIVSELKQTLPFGLDISSFDFIKEGLVAKQKLIEEFQVLSQALTDKSSPTKGELAEIDEIQNRIESTGGWDLDLMVKTIMSELSLPNKNMKELSGGWQRRVALAKALVSKPELLLLDEPTNHLDIETIEWLENKINQYAGAVIFVTHDRNFLKKIASKILELDRGLIYTYPGSYEEHLIRKAEALENERKHNKLFDKKLAEEEIWINQGVKARRTRNEGRVRSLEKMREVKDERVKPERDLKIQIAETTASGKKIVDLEKIGHRFNQSEESWLIEDFTLKIKRGEKIGLVGNNGVGKSTLLKILTGKITPEKGTVKFGANLEQVYFDQVHRDLKANQTISYNISDGRNYIEMNGKSIHVVGYLKNYLFDYERSNEKVDRLSGGEKNRVLLARLFASPSNLLILDEPTNDLDLEMIEALEEALKTYDGTIIMVSHDRYFLDKVATACLVFEDDGVIRKYHGGYSDWLDLKDRYGKGLKVVDSKENAKRIKQNSKKSGRQNNKKRQEVSSFSEEKEVSTKERKKREKKLLLEVSELEKTLADLSKEVSSEEFQNKPFEQQSTLYDRIAEVQTELDEKTEEWAGLDS